MDTELKDRYSRHLPLQTIGKENQLKLANKRVLIAGLGGLGTISSELLASIGIGYLRVVDYDVVERSNLPRQKLYTDQDIGKAKVDVASDKLKLRNPEIEIDPKATRIDAMSSSSLLDGIDLIIDGLDTFSSRKALFRAAFKMNVPYIFAGSVGEQANVMTFTHKEDNPCLQCVVGDPGDSRENSCEVRGVHPAILTIAASIQVSEAIKVLTGQSPDLEKKMVYIDLLGTTFDKIKFVKNTSCRICGKKESEDELDSGKHGEVTRGRRRIQSHGKALVTSLCGRDTFIIDPSWEINWNFDEVFRKLREKYHIVTSGDNYITINKQGAGISLLTSGVATIRGSGSSNKAISLYTELFDYLQT